MAGPGGADAVSAVAGRLGRALEDELGRAGGAPAAVTAWRAARSTWGQVRPTLTRAATSLVLPGVPGGAVLDPDPALAARGPLARAAGTAVRAALAAPAPPGPPGPAERARLPDDLAVLVLAFELRQGPATWRLRVCLPGHTLAAIVAALARPPAAPPPPPVAPTSPELPPQVELVREIARANPAYVADMLRRLMSADG